MLAVRSALMMHMLLCWGAVGVYIASSLNLPYILWREALSCVQVLALIYVMLIFLLGRIGFAS